MAARPTVRGIIVAAMLVAGLSGFATAQTPTRVDVELVLAVDISYSMDVEEQALQREGYAKALVSQPFLDAVARGPNGRIAVTYFEWAGAADQRTIVPWRLIDGPQSAAAIAAEILATPLRRAARTSISGAINYAEPLFGSAGFRGLRRVLDISGDGANNQGELVTAARDRAVEKGIVINGLPIMLKRPTYAMMDIETLDLYYEDCVIGGAGAFVIPVRERDQFADAIRRKLILEVAGRMPSRAAPAPRVMLASASDGAAPPRVDCQIGERLWQNRWRD